MSTRVCLAVTALRMRVIMSEIGSVILPSSLVRRKEEGERRSAAVPFSSLLPSIFFLLPRALRHARDVAFERQLAEAEPAHVELPQIRARAAAQVAAVAVANLELERLRFLGDLCGRGHSISFRRKKALFFLLSSFPYAVRKGMPI